MACTFEPILCNSPVNAIAMLIPNIRPLVSSARSSTQLIRFCPCWRISCSSSEKSTKSILSMHTLLSPICTQGPLKGIILIGVLPLLSLTLNSSVDYPVRLLWF